MTDIDVSKETLDIRHDHILLVHVERHRSELGGRGPHSWIQTTISTMSPEYSPTTIRLYSADDAERLIAALRTHLDNVRGEQ